MSVIYSPPLPHDRLQLVANALDAGGGPGVLRLLDGGGGVLSSMGLAFPASTVTGAVLAFNGLPLVDPLAAASGACVAARFEDSLGNTVISGLTVGQSSAADILLTPTNTITAGQTIAIQQARITSI